MDLSFGLGRARHRAAPVLLDYPQLTAIVTAIQAASRTAQVENGLCRGAAAAATPVDKLVALFACGADWIAAAQALGGSFNPAAAGRAP